MVRAAGGTTEEGERGEVSRLGRGGCLLKEGTGCLHEWDSQQYTQSCISEIRFFTQPEQVDLPSIRRPGVDRSLYVVLCKEDLMEVLLCGNTKVTCMV